MNNEVPSPLAPFPPLCSAAKTQTLPELAFTRTRLIVLAATFPVPQKPNAEHVVSMNAHARTPAETHKRAVRQPLSGTAVRGAS